MLLADEVLNTAKPIFLSFLQPVATATDAIKTQNKYFILVFLFIVYEMKKL